MIDAEYDELDDSALELADELDLADTDSLPWLEADEEDETAGGIDTGQIALFALGLMALLGAVVGGVWWVSHRAAGSELVADGSIIPPPEGPVKEKPENPGGKEFAGTGNVAPLVGEGGSRPAVVADAPVTSPSAAPAPASSGTKPVPAATPAPGQAPATGGVGVQLAAYGTRARAEQGWTDIARRTDALTGIKYRVVEGKVDIGTVYRLQAVTGSRAEAEKLCAALKADGVDCQIK